MKSSLINFISLAACLLVVSQPGYANMKCWINKDKVRECGLDVPPEYAQQRIEILNSKGIVVDVIERAKTPEELAEIRRQDELRKAREKKIAEQKRKDMVLLQTYTTERDILLSRKQNIRAIEGIINITNSNTSIMQDNLKILEKRAADYERAGQTPPAELLKDMDALKIQIKDNQEFIAKKKVSQREVEHKFDTALRRFRELKGIKNEQEK